MSPLFKASVSVLLTLVDPEESVTREEEAKLLGNPQALWTVLVFGSSSSSMTSDPREYLTPIAQFVRGIVSSLQTQRVNTTLIYDMLRNQLNNSDDGDIFDDESFTKSILYHWAIKTCDALSESLASTLRFTHGMLYSSVETLCRGAHECEKLGIDHWTQQLKKEILGIEELNAQVLAMKGQVQENVSTPNHEKH
jgi:hypothetical protein